ncbi:MAG: hypothetical protein [Wendovervirus sonii]|uniref:Uncharacterized protein n=1 Tax=phage Lak_Megaphage_Sonny TaxID=3109229 RepID=A0ABZ0Z2V3_9CAUD|nr:MAG: hypothetical protein [phage Lak_Megaphage_Sonny]
MAKIIIRNEYDIRLEDRVIFKSNGHKYKGTVQCISTLPDSIWVETGCSNIEWNGDPYDLIGYRRWEITLNQIDFDDDRTESQLIETIDCTFKKKENVEFVYSENYKERIKTQHES